MLEMFHRYGTGVSYRLSLIPLAESDQGDFQNRYGWARGRYRVVSRAKQQ